MLKRAQLLGLTVVLSLSFTMSLALATAKAASLPNKFVCSSTEKVEVGGQLRAEFEVQLERKTPNHGVARVLRVKGANLERISARVNLVQTNESTKGYLPGFLIARSKDLSLSINVQKLPRRATLWVPDLGERDGVLLHCK